MPKDAVVRWNTVAGHKCPACGRPIRRTDSHSSLPPPMQHFECRYPIPPKQMRLT